MTIRIETTEHCTLYLGDCLDVLPTLGKVDAVVTDPPYGINGSSGTINKQRAKGSYEADFVDDVSYVASVCVPVIRICRDMASAVVLTPGMPNCWEYPKPDAVGFVDQPASVGLCKWGAVTCQPIIFYGRDPRLGKDIGRLTVKITERAEECGHPCPKPLSLAEWLVERASLEGDLVLDPFMGSGTTGVACVNTGRRFIGIEKEPKYFEIALKRIREAERMAKCDLFKAKERDELRQGVLC